MNYTGQYLRSVQIVKQKNRTYVGIPTNLKKTRKGDRTSKRTLNQVAIMLEYGSRGGNLPPRPLWAPAFEQVGGKKVLKETIVRELRKEIRKYRIWWRIVLPMKSRRPTLVWSVSCKEETISCWTPGKSSSTKKRYPFCRSEPDFFRILLPGNNFSDKKCAFQRLMLMKGALSLSLLPAQEPWPFHIGSLVKRY